MKDDPRVVKAIKKIKDLYETGQIGHSEMADRILAAVEDDGWKETT